MGKKTTNRLGIFEIINSIAYYKDERGFFQNYFLGFQKQSYREELPPLQQIGVNVIGFLSPSNLS